MLAPQVREPTIRDEEADPGSDGETGVALGPVTLVSDYLTALRGKRVSSTAR